jgi:hypothetical protein
LDRLSIGRSWRTSAKRPPEGLPPDPLRRRVRGDEDRECRLDGDQLAEERVVLGVRELGVVLLVVEPVGATDLVHELRVAGGRGLLVQRRGGIDEGGIDGKRLGHRGRVYARDVSSRVRNLRAQARRAGL